MYDCTYVQVRVLEACEENISGLNLEWGEARTLRDRVRLRHRPEQSRVLWIQPHRFSHVSSKQFLRFGRIGLAHFYELRTLGRTRLIQVEIDDLRNGLGIVNGRASREAVDVGDDVAHRATGSGKPREEGVIGLRWFVKRL